MRFRFSSDLYAAIIGAKFRYGMASVYGTPKQLALYRPDLLIPKQKGSFDKIRLVLTGQKLWSKETTKTHKLLNSEGIRHHYDNTLECPHR